ncbi:MAG TPA: NADH-quinone oxidoreductase subunit M [Bacteroidota bacterium]|nr:NADH-quinone oxidoreductase subunit M [Bacteroidota bacterium]
MTVESLLILLIFLPLTGALAVMAIGRSSVRAIKGAGIAVSLAAFAVSLALASGFNPDLEGFQMVSRYPWVDTLSISFHVGIDGMSLLLILLTTFMTPIALLASWNSIEKRVKEYVVMMLLLEAGILGVFAALDLFLFYIFWEAMLIPMYFIIGIWGGSNRVYAAVKFFLYTMSGSLLMLVAIIWLGYQGPLQVGQGFTTDLVKLYGVGPLLPAHLQLWMFLAFTLSFAIKVPLFPFHTWLPDAHVEAPTSGSVMLAAVLLKMGTYGFLRFCIPLFPSATLACIPWLSALAVIGIVYGALVSMVQTDIKKLVAYSSVSHLGFVVLGIFAMTEESVQGGILQMVNHGLSTGALFLLVGMLYDRRHTREISEFGGIAKVMPVIAAFFMIISLSSIGLPGLNGFVGEFLILIGAYSSPHLSGWFAVVSSTGVILAAVYLLWMYQRVFFGENLNPKNSALKDLSPREAAVLVPVVLFIVWIGVFPGTFLKLSGRSTQDLVNTFRRTSSGMTTQAVTPPAQVISHAP